MKQITTKFFCDICKEEKETAKSIENRIRFHLKEYYEENGIALLRGNEEICNDCFEVIEIAINNVLNKIRKVKSYPRCIVCGKGKLIDHRCNQCGISYTKMVKPVKTPLVNLRHALLDSLHVTGDYEAVIQHVADELLKHK